MSHKSLLTSVRSPLSSQPTAASDEAIWMPAKRSIKWSMSFWLFICHWKGGWAFIPPAFFQATAEILRLQSSWDMLFPSPFLLLQPSLQKPSPKAWGLETKGCYAEGNNQTGFSFHQAHGMPPQWPKKWPLHGPSYLARIKLWCAHWISMIARISCSILPSGEKGEKRRV